MKKNLFICIIPARSGSKRIKNKNIKKFINKPIIGQVINNIKTSKCFKDIFVSTDSIKIKKISEKYGAKVPFLRSKKLSSDNILINQVVVDFIKKLEKNNYDFKYVCVVYPTAVFINKKKILQAIKILKNKKVKFVFVAKKYSHPINRAFYIKKNKTRMLNSRNYESRTQNFKNSYYDTGQFYFSDKKNFKKNINPFNSNSKPILDKYSESIDIDTLDDWKTAEFLIRLTSKVKRKSLLNEI